MRLIARHFFIGTLLFTGCGSFGESAYNSPPVLLRVDAPSRLSGTDTIRIYTYDADEDEVAVLFSAVDQNGSAVTDAFLRAPLDDGLDGDEAANDRIFTGFFNSALLQALPSNHVTVQLRLEDSRHALSEAYSVTVESCVAGTAPVISNLVAPDTVRLSLVSTFLIMLTASDADGLFDITSVTRTTPSGLVLPLRDDGSNGDAVAGDGIFTETVSVNPPPPTGSYLFRFQARDCAGLTSNELQKTIVIAN